MAAGPTSCSSDAARLRLRSHVLVTALAAACGLAYAIGCTGRISDSRVTSNAGPMQPTAASPASSGSRAQDPAGRAGNAAPTLNPLDCSAPATASTPLQRLTRRQYASTVQELFGVTLDVDTLTADEKIAAFSANTIAPVSELTVEQYMDAAEGVALQAESRLPALVSCDWAKDANACAASFVANVGRRVYRRPLSSTEADRYVALFKTSLAGHANEDALRVVTQSMLQSPNFLYHLELSEVAQGSGAVVPLDPYELAARLAFFLTGSTPDDALLDAARDAKLADDAGLQAQAARLLDDPRSNAALEAFHFEWLELDDLARVEKDAAVYPGFDAAFRQAMHDETAHFVDYVIRDGDGKLASLLTAPFSFPSGPLLDLYGVKAGDPKLPVQLDAKQRAGLLTQPAFLAVHAHANQTGPVQRGKFVIRNVLCEALPDPPPNVNTTPPDPSPTATTRERLAEHEKDASCASCHVRIDGIGLGFEQYDGMGRFRTSEAGQPIDPSGKFVGTRDLNGTFSGAVELAKKLASSPEVQACVATQWFRFALGRLESDPDACSLAQLNSDFQASGQNVKALLTSVVMTTSFRTKRVSAP